MLYGQVLVAIAMAKQPVHRFATANDLATAFRHAVAGTLDGATARRATTLLADTP